MRTLTGNLLQMKVLKHQLPSVLTLTKGLTGVSQESQAFVTDYIIPKQFAHEERQFFLITGRQPTLILRKKN